MPFTAPEADIQSDASTKGGFVAPLTDTPVKGFLAPDADVAEWETARQAGLNAAIDPTAFAGSVNQPSQFGGGYSLDPPNLLNADDWGFTATLAGPFGPAAKIGQTLNAAGQAVKGGSEALLFWRTGQPHLAAQELAATASNISPAVKERLDKQGVDTSNPYEDARQQLPPVERIASGIGPELLQSAPQLALTAVQPELGATSFGFTPQGFDPVQAAAMMVAPEGGKLVGGLAKELAAKAGISDAQALGTINRLGGGAGVAGVISVPTAYQIAQMKPGPERNEAIQDAASNAILTSLLGSIVVRDGSERPNAETEGARENSVPAVLPTQASDTGKIKNQPAAAGGFAGALWAELLGQDQKVNLPDVDQIIRNVFPVEEQSTAIPNQIPQYDVNNAGVRDRSLNDQAASGSQALASAQNPKGNEVSANPLAEKPISQKIGDLTAAVDEIKAALTANQISSKPSKLAATEMPEIHRHEAGPAFSPSDENDLTPTTPQQSIKEAINEKHRQTTATVDESAASGTDNVVQGRSESAFARIQQIAGAVLRNTVFDSGFAGTPTGKRVRQIASIAGAEAVFYKGGDDAPVGLSDGKTIFIRSNAPEPEIFTALEHETAHHVKDSDPRIIQLTNDVDLLSAVVQKFRAQYSAWLLSHGRAPLTDEETRHEIVAAHVAGESPYGLDLSEAFRDQQGSVDVAREYHQSTPAQAALGASEEPPRFSPANTSPSRPSGSEHIPSADEAQAQLAKPLSREWGKYDLRKIPVGSDPIALSQSFPKSETTVTPQKLPKTSDSLRLWAKNQLGNLPGVVRSPWGNDVVLHGSSDVADRASQYIYGGTGFGPSRDHAATLPMLANTIGNAMAYATVRGRAWSAYLYRYAGGQLHVVIVDNERGTVERQFVAKQDPRDPNIRVGSDLRVLYRNGVGGTQRETLSGEQPPAQRTILDKGLREVWFQPDIQRAWQQVRSSVTAKEMTDEFNRSKAQGLPTDPAMAQEDAAIARVINSDGRYRIVDNFLETFGTALKQKLKSNVPVTAMAQLKEAAIQFLRNRTVQAPGLGSPPKGMIPLGQWGETWLSHVLRGRGTKPSKPFVTSLGARYSDRVFNGIAHEAKAGFKVKLNDRIRNQILKDAELVALNRFDGVHWHFFRGAEPDVLKFLEQNDIGYTVY